MEWKIFIKEDVYIKLPGTTERTLNKNEAWRNKWKKKRFSFLKVEGLHGRRMEEYKKA